MIVERPQYTPEDLLRIPGGERYELVDGNLMERGMGYKASTVASRLGYALNKHCEANPLGHVADADGGYQCFPGQPNLLRYADVSFIRFGRLPGEEIPDGHCRIAPDLVAEVISPNDIAYDVERKLGEWLSAGVQLVWMLYPDVKTVRVHRADGSAAYLTEKEDLTGDAVLPGFRVRVEELFRPRRPGN